MLQTGAVFGLPVTAGRFKEVASDILRRARARRGGYVCVANAHMLTLARRDGALGDILKRAALVTSDGMPIVWSLRRRGCSEAERVSGPDLMDRLCAMAARDSLPTYFYGGRPQALAAFRRALSEYYPDLPIAGCEAPGDLPQKPPLDAGATQRIRDSGASLVFVGLGCPKQEYWMGAHAPHIDALMIGVGAAFDFTAGTLRRAPRWMQRAGLEWLFRLIMEPRRLWKRYLITNTLFLYYLSRNR